MNEQDYITQINNLTKEQIAQGILEGIVTFKRLQETGDFDFSTQRSVKAILNTKDDEAFAAANSKTELQNYISVFPQGNHIDNVQAKIQKIKDDEDDVRRRYEEQERTLKEIKQNINKYTPPEIKNKLSSEIIDELCNDLEIDSQMIKNFKEPPIRFNTIPKSEKDIPLDYTDVFFWGIPSSGKTCALSAILSTIKKDFSMEEPDCEIKFGATYRASLVNIFKSDIGYLPPRTNEDRTQYMPFLFYKRGERNKRKISFFELSGEVFKYFFDKVNGSEIISADVKESIEQSFKTLELLLNSNNQKIHFFFIDYDAETKHSIDETTGLTQENYLTAAAAYFRDNNDIFKKKTDAVYVVVTKSDEIQGDNRARLVKAKSFLDENFGSFMDVLRNQCDRNSIDFNVKIFSIGDVYFKWICKINRAYSTNIINDLLERVRPISTSRLRNFFNS